MKQPSNQIVFARKLRVNGTNAEKLLWSKLRRKQIKGLKFRRQESIGNYIVDFVNYDSRIIIELDGGQHNTIIGKERDYVREKWFREQDFRILRFWNNDVLTNIEGVMEIIKCKIHPQPSLLPSREKENIDNNS